MSTFEMNDRRAGLIYKKILSELTEEENNELENWRSLSEKNDQLVKDLTGPAVIDKLEQFSQFDPEIGYSRFLELKNESSLEERERESSKEITGRNYWLVGIAAAIIIVASLVVLYSIRDEKRSTEEVVKKDTSAVYVNDSSNMNDVTLLLGEGEQIKLDSADNKVINTKQGNFMVVQQGAMLIYLLQRNKGENAVPFNTLKIPAGTSYVVLLPDGSKAWLSARSSIRFLVQDTSKVRRVEITGEVYFEVSAASSKPFIVKVGTMDVTAWGTRFNVNAYEGKIRTALMEGKVDVTVGGHVTQMKKGEIAVIDTINYVVEKKTISNIEDEIAWKEGVFKFNNADILEVMKQLTTWYGVKVKYINVPDVHVTAKYNRNWSLDRVLKYLEENNGVHYKISNNEISISSNRIPK